MKRVFNAVCQPDHMSSIIGVDFCLNQPTQPAVFHVTFLFCTMLIPQNTGNNMGNSAHFCTSHQSHYAVELTVHTST